MKTIECERLVVRSPRGGPSIEIATDGQTAGVWVMNDRGGVIGLVIDNVSHQPYVLIKRGNRTRTITIDADSLSTTKETDPS